MTNYARTPASKLPLYETNNFQDPDPAFLVDGDSPKDIRIRRARFWVSTLLNVLILIGVMVSLVFLSRLWDDYHCRRQEHIEVMLPCEPVDVATYIDEAKRPASREVWCSAPLAFVDPEDYDCLSLLTSAEPTSALNTTCYKAQVSYRAWFPKSKPTALGTGLRTFHPEVQITRTFVFTCPRGGPEKSFSYLIPIKRGIPAKDYLIASYDDEFPKPRPITTVIVN